MRIFIQRVTEAAVTIDNTIFSSIKNGFLILVGIENDDTNEAIKWLGNKVCNLRIFNDEAGKMNRSIKETAGEILLVSQFTLLAQTKGSNRPSFIKAAKPAIAIPLYEKLIVELETNLGKKIATGKFGADMKISLVNDGPVSIWIDSKNKE